MGLKLKELYKNYNTDKAIYKRINLYNNKM